MKCPECGELVNTNGLFKRPKLCNTCYAPANNISLIRIGAISATWIRDKKIKDTSPSWENAVKTIEDGIPARA